MARAGGVSENCAHEIDLERSKLMSSRSNSWFSALVCVAIFSFMAYQQAEKGHTQAAMIMGGIAAAIVIPVAAYFILRSMKGSLKLDLAQKSVMSGQPITGQLHLVTKKAVHADRLYIALVGERQSKRRSSGRSGSSTYWDEFYRDEVDVLVDQTLHPGTRQSVDFELNAPTEGQVMSAGQAIQKASEAMENGMAKALVQGVGTLASVMGGRKRWRVIARLETKGVDLAASRKLHVSLKQL